MSQAPSRLAWLRQVFVEEVPEQAQAPAPVTIPTVATPAAPTTVTAPPPPSADAERVRSLDESSRQRLVIALEKDDAPLFEEMANTLESLREAIPDEAARYKAALKLLAKRASTPALLTDYDKSLGTVEQTYREFEADLQRQVDSRVGAKRRAVEDYGKQITTLNQQLEALRNQIAELASKQAAEQSGISSEEAKVALVKQRFDLAYQAVRHEIETQRAKIAQYGQG